MDRRPAGTHETERAEPALNEPHKRKRRSLDLFSSPLLNFVSQLVDPAMSRSATLTEMRIILASLAMGLLVSALSRQTRKRQTRKMIGALPSAGRSS